MYTAEQIQQATGAPLSNIQAQWPLVVAALKWAGIDSHLVRVAAVATIARETGIFAPIPEGGDEAYFRRELGNDWYYHGRGLLQLTWSSNYRHYGDEMGVDLVANPDLALHDDISAKVLALYFRERGTAAAANAGNWQSVQTTVNGGYINYDRFLAVVNALLPVHEPPDTSPVDVTTVAVQTVLRTIPATNGVHAKSPEHPDGYLPVGTVVHFEPDPQQGQYHGKETTPHWAHILVGKGPMHGWVPRADLQTVSG